MKKIVFSLPEPLGEAGITRIERWEDGTVVVEFPFERVTVSEDGVTFDAVYGDDESGVQEEEVHLFASWDAEGT